MANGVKISGLTIEDGFHRNQLSIKYFSATACGLTEKGCHEWVHHHQMIQADWGIYVQDTRPYMMLAAKILSDKAKEGMPHSMRESSTQDVSLIARHLKTYSRVMYIHHVTQNRCQFGVLDGGMYTSR